MKIDQTELEKIAALIKAECRSEKWKSEKFGSWGV